MARKSKSKGVFGFPGGSGGKNLIAKQEIQVQFLSWDPLRKGMVTHSNILARRIRGQGA